MPKPTVNPDQIRVVPTRAEALAKVTQLDGTRSRVPAAAAAADPATAPQANSDGTTGELWLYGLVGGWYYGFNADSVSKALRGMEVDNLIVRIHSPGGSASDGIAIGNLLRNYDAKVTVVVDGLAASAASVIALAGDRVVMCPGSQMMLHDAKTGIWGDEIDLRTMADWIGGQSANYAGIYAYRAGGTPESWREVMRANDRWGTWYTADEAVAAGLADEVGTRIAVGSPPTAPDDLDEEDDDSWALAVHDLDLLEHYIPAAARAAWNGEQPPKPPTASAEGSNKTEGGSAVAFSDEGTNSLRTRLGVAEDADEATILAALDEALDERAEPPAAETKPTPAAATAVPEGMTLIESDVLAGLREQGTQGAAARQQQLDEKRDTTIAQAVKDGKITPARVAHWTTSWNADSEGTEQLLASLETGIVPVAERGHDQQSTGAQSAYDDLYGTQKGA